jgi:hypothetical protein
MIPLQHCFRSIVEHKGGSAHIMGVEQIGISPNGADQVWVKVFAETGEDTLMEGSPQAPLGVGVTLKAEEHVLRGTSVRDKRPVRLQEFLQMIHKVIWEADSESIQAPSTLADLQLIALEPELPYALGVLVEVPA